VDQEGVGIYDFRTNKEFTLKERRMVSGRSRLCRVPDPLGTGTNARQPQLAIWQLLVSSVVAVAFMGLMSRSWWCAGGTPRPERPGDAQPIAILECGKRLCSSGTG
jgi:hypothetical protein